MVLHRQAVESLFEAVYQRVKRTSQGGEVLSGTGKAGGWSAWMVFVELFDAHHTPSELYWRNDHGPQRLSHLHQSSLSELYTVITSASPNLVRQRTLRWDSISRCCFAQDGMPLPTDACDPHLAHDEWAGSFDFVTCHDALRVESEWSNTSYPHYPSLNNASLNANNGEGGAVAVGAEGATRYSC